eukprot:gene9160-8251_t
MLYPTSWHVARFELDVRLENVQTPLYAPPASGLSLVANYSGSTFFDNFDFFTANVPPQLPAGQIMALSRYIWPLHGASTAEHALHQQDPTHGTVDFVDAAAAASL